MREHVGALQGIEPVKYPQGTCVSSETNELTESLILAQDERWRRA